MSARDRRLAKEMAAKHEGFESASDKAARKHKEKVEKRGGTVKGRREAMTDLISTPRDEKSRSRARASKRNIQDHGDAFTSGDRKKFFGF